MKANEIHDLFNSFESIAIEYDDVECWRALIVNNVWRKSMPTVLIG